MKTVLSEKADATIFAPDNSQADIAPLMGIIKKSITLMENKFLYTGECGCILLISDCKM